MFASTYHIVWSTYGTWLPGDERGWIRKNTLGVHAPDPEAEEKARNRMADQAVVLSLMQRAIVEQTIRDHCRIRNWTLHALNVRSNHIHVIVTADRKPNEVMNQLKAWCSRRLSDATGLQSNVAKNAGRRRWFTEGGDKEIIKDDEYFHNAVQYVVDGQ